MTRCDGRWLGIDFSGDVKQWSAGRRKSNIWIADVRGYGSGLVLHDLRRVQRLPGDAPPFKRLASFLRGTFSAAPIDAPFSVPADFVREHPVAVTGQPPPLSPPKPLRETDKRWQREGVNVRSTLWAGARGGAPMTAACLTLLDLAGGPVWPFTPNGTSLLVEGFPAAQLCAWDLPHQGYGDVVQGTDTRGVILKSLKTRLDLGGFEPQMKQSADALDAVLCTFGAMAVTEGRLLEEPGPTASTEGWIAVHR